MQKFILLRGHQGSGKSTFAAQKIAEFRQQFPNAQIVHIENDLFLTDENGVYHWSRDGIEKAMQKSQNLMKAACKQAQANPQNDFLIINSNTNQKTPSCESLIHLAKKHGLECEVYRLHNFYPNLHGVDEYQVLTVYQRLNNNPVQGEIHVEASLPISGSLKNKLAQMQHTEKQSLPFDETQQTFVTEHYLQTGQRDFTAKASKIYPQLRVLKYRRHVFYNNSFNAALLEMRGMIIDAHNRIIVRPFKKVFNYSERVAKKSKYPIDISDNHLVNAVVKINGFLGCCTHVSLPENHPSHAENFNGKTLFSTTGSLDSDFAKMTKKHCAQFETLFCAFPNHTFLFEINDPSDIHIINEDFGATLIGAIEVATGKQWREHELDEIAQKYAIKRPKTLRNMAFGDLKKLLKNVQHEGFMVFDAASEEMLFKLKSPYYLVSKFFGRSSDKNLARKLDKHNVDEEYYPLIDHISENKQYFNSLDELAKIAFIQDFLRNQI